MIRNFHFPPITESEASRPQLKILFFKLSPPREVYLQKGRYLSIGRLAWGTMAELTDKIAVITWGNSEIGPATAKRVFKEGAYDRRRRQ
jgi:hypothetical protein